MISEEKGGNIKVKKILITKRETSKRKEMKGLKTLQNSNAGKRKSDMEGLDLEK